MKYAEIKWLAQNCIEFSLISWTRWLTCWRADLTNNMTQNMAATVCALQTSNHSKQNWRMVPATGIWNPLPCLNWDYPSHWVPAGWVWQGNQGWPIPVRHRSLLMTNFGSRTPLPRSPAQLSLDQLLLECLALFFSQGQWHIPVCWLSSSSHFISYAFPLIKSLQA